MLLLGCQGAACRGLLQRIDGPQSSHTPEQARRIERQTDGVAPGADREQLLQRRRCLGQAGGIEAGQLRFLGDRQARQSQGVVQACPPQGGRIKLLPQFPVQLRRAGQPCLRQLQGRAVGHQQQVGAQAAGIAVGQFPEQGCFAV